MCFIRFFNGKFSIFSGHVVFVYAILLVLATWHFVCVVNVLFLTISRHVCFCRLFATQTSLI